MYAPDTGDNLTAPWAPNGPAELRTRLFVAKHAISLGHLDSTSSWPGLVETAIFPAACFYDNLLFMAKPTKDNRKISRGRPATGTAPLVGVRMPESLQVGIRTWAQHQPDNPKLATAVRRLVEIALALPISPDPKSESRRQRARDMASKAIDKLADSAVSADEQADRKRQLVKGPEEFQKVRRDLGK